MAGSIRVWPETYARLLKIAHEMELACEHRVPLDDVIRELLVNREQLRERQLRDASK